MTSIEPVESNWMYINCIVCGSNGSKQIARDRIGENSFNLMQCVKCGFIYVNPRRTDIGKGTYFQSNVSDYDTLHLGPFKESVFKDVLTRITRYTNERDLLDIGAGLGYFLYLARQQGFNIYGIEPSQPFVDFAKTHYNINVKPGFLESTDFGDKKFGIITMVDVIEHVLNLQETVEKCENLLKSQGLFVLRFPNATQHKLKEWLLRPIYDMYKKPVWCSEIGHHINFFSRNTIIRFLEKYGFDILSISNSKTELHDNKLKSFLKVFWEKFAFGFHLLTGAHIANSLIVIAKKR